MSKHIDGIDENEMNVADMEATVAFLKRAGFTETRRTEHTGGSVELRFPGGPDAPIFEINQSDDEPKGFQHIAMRATDIDAAYKDYVDAGFEFIRPLYGQKPSSSGRRIFNLKDPEGKKLQVSTRIQEE